MKRLLLAITPIAALLALSGCDETLLPESLRSMTSSVIKFDAAKPTADQIRQQLHLMDGSGDGSQNQYGGEGGGQGGGSGDGDQDRRRDGSCGDGG